jgi:predicted ATPase
MDTFALPEVPKFEAVEIESFPGISGRVRLELDPTCTVLVGKNGAGKSVIVEALARAAWTARMRNLAVQELAFRCEISRPLLPTLIYEYRQTINENIDVVDGRQSEEWFERCAELRGDEIWRVENSNLIIRGTVAESIPPFAGMLFMGEDHPLGVGKEAVAISRMLEGVYLVSAGLIRRSEGNQRENLLISNSFSRSNRLKIRNTVQGSLESLARWIVFQRERDESIYEEFVEILRMLGLAREVVVENYQGSTHGDPGFSSVLLDGVNLGLHSDGTLRTIQIVVQLLQKGITCLLVEEPELAVHPGLLGKLLALMTSYSLDRQIVVTTHSPQVVDWASPSQLRLVEREGAVTRIRRIEESQMQLLAQYLQDQGTLADFLYGHESL